MKVLNRNKSTVYYAPFQSKTAMVDGAGHKTGEYAVVYANPVAVKGNVSPVTGPAVTYPFGTDTEYDRVVMFDNTSLPITETTRFWVDTLPVLDPVSGATNTPHDYEVKRVAKSFNYLVVALKGVTIS